MRIPVTALESFRLYQTEDWMSEADLVASLKHEGVPTPGLLIGRAFDAIVCEPFHYQVPGGYLCDGYSFGDDDMALVFAALDPRIIWQVKTAKVWPLPTDAPTVVAKADGVLGQRLIENKTTLSSFDFAHYERGYQWKFYLDLFEAPAIEYHVFRLNDHGNGVIDVRDVETFMLYPYPALHDDCSELLTQFLDFIKAKHLELYFEPRVGAAAGEV